MAEIGKKWKQWQILLSWTPKSLKMVTEAMKLKDACSLEEKLWPSRQHIKKERHYFADKGSSSQSYGFSSSHVWMWELDHKEGWMPKNWCFWNTVLEKTLEGLLESKETNPINPKGNKSEYSLEALMLKLKHQYSGHLMWKANSLEKLWCWEWFRARGEGGNRGWHGWMALLTQWTLVWANSRR